MLIIYQHEVDGESDCGKIVSSIKSERERLTSGTMKTK